MARMRVDPRSVGLDARVLLGERDMLLAAGDFAAGAYNAMTVGWGSFGSMWGKDIAQVVVRPCRYTFGFMNGHGTFTLSAFGEAFRPALNLLGAKSGRDGDKIAEAGLHPEPSLAVAAPSFAEAELVIECRTLYWQDLDPELFLDPAIMRHYPKRDFHRVYWGEIVAMSRAAGG